MSAADLEGLHIALLTASASRLGGGVASVVQVQSRMIRAAGGQVTVVALEDAYSHEDRALLGEAPLVTARVAGLAFFGYAPPLHEQLRQIDPDLLHAFEVDKELYEFAYAATYLPSWLYAPTEGMRALFDDGRG